jgi:hypothetical protein
MDLWLTHAREAVAGATGLPPEELELSDEDAATLLELARVAAHESGERTNAPLLCYLVGRAAERSGQDVDSLADAVRRTS